MGRLPFLRLAGGFRAGRGWSLSSRRPGRSRGCPTTLRVSLIDEKEQIRKDAEAQSWTQVPVVGGKGCHRHDPCSMTS